MQCMCPRTTKGMEALIKTLSIIQPYATLLAIGAKRIETRSWSTPYRGIIAIHASKGFPRWAKDTCSDEPFASALGKSTLYLGAVIAVGRLVDCLPMESHGCLPGVFDDYPDLRTDQELEFGDFSPGRWAWLLEGMVPVGPWPAKGSLGLWDWKEGDI